MTKESQNTGGLSDLLEIVIDREEKVPYLAQIYIAIREAIVTGKLPPGSRLLSSRALALKINVSRICVVQAYAQLLSEGLIVGRSGSGTYVSDALSAMRVEPARASAGQGTGVAGKLSKAGADAGRLWAGLPIYDNIPFNLGVSSTDPTTLQTLRRIGQRQLGLIGETHRGFGHVQGLPELRHHIAQYLTVMRGLRCSAGQIVIVNGAHQAFDLALRVLVDPGRTVVMEDPCYAPYRDAVGLMGGIIAPVPVDAEGIRADLVAATVSDAAAVVVTPSSQYPLGVPLAFERRMQLLAWARSRQSWIVEFDVDNEFRYAGRSLAALQGLDDDGRVVYIGNLSKALLPGLSLAYLVVPKDLTDAFVASRFLVDGRPGLLPQLILSDFLGNGHLSGHLRRMRLHYENARSRLIGQIRRHLPGDVDIEVPTQGIHIVARFNGRTDDVAVSDRARQAGVVARAISPLCHERNDLHGLLLGFTGFSDTEINLAAARLARAF